MEMEFEASFFNEVLQPSNIIPMNQDQVEEDLSTVWSNIHDVNTFVKHLDVTVEEVGEDLTVFVEGNLERINPLRYLGNVKGEDIIVEENGDRITIRAPKRISGNWLLKGIETMAEARMKMLEEVVILEHPTQRGSEKIPFSLTLFYTVE